MSHSVTSTKTILILSPFIGYGKSRTFPKPWTCHQTRSKSHAVSFLKSKTSWICIVSICRISPLVLESTLFLMVSCHVYIQYWHYMEWRNYLDNLKKYLNRIGYSMKKMFKQCQIRSGIQYPILSQIERSRKIPKASALRGIPAALLPMCRSNSKAIRLIEVSVQRFHKILGSR